VIWTRPCICSVLGLPIALIVLALAVTLAWSTGKLTPRDLGAVYGGVPFGNDWWRLLAAPFVYDNAGYEFVALLAVGVFGTALEQRFNWFVPIALFLAAGAAGVYPISQRHPGQHHRGMVQVNGAQLFYQLTGSGDYLMHVPGAVVAHHGYAAVTPEMARHFTVLDFDPRGYGQSDRRKQRYTFDVWADDMAGLLDALGIERTHVHGGSMGSSLAVHYAAKYPDRVNGLIPIDLSNPLGSLRKIEEWVADGPCVGIKYYGGNPGGAGWAMRHATRTRLSTSTVNPTDL